MPCSQLDEEQESERETQAAGDQCIRSVSGTYKRMPAALSASHWRVAAAPRMVTA